MRTFFRAVQQEASFRTLGLVPDLETYMEMRRKTSACKLVFDLIEYSLDLELPDNVMGHPVIMALNQAANDLVTWSNVSAIWSPLLTGTPCANKRCPGHILIQYRAISSRPE
jgi:hypothetical protein